MTTPISVCIISFNEEDRIAQCLAAVSNCQEIILVDSHSTDNTVALAKTFGARIFARDFNGYRSQKRFAVAQASHDWVLCLDADEVLSEQLQQSIKKFQRQIEMPFSAYQFSRCTHYYGKYLKHGIAYPDRVLRLFDKNQAGWDSEREIHEHVVNRGKTGLLAGDLLHYSYRNSLHEKSKLHCYAKHMAEHRFKENVRPLLSKMLIAPLWHLVRGVVLRLGILDGWQGLRFHWRYAKYAGKKEWFLYQMYRSKV